MDSNKETPSLEKLIESEDIGIEVLHPGGSDVTLELAELCKISKSSKVLEIASGTGESACLIAERTGAHITGIDVSEDMIRRARIKAESKGLRILFVNEDAHQLPFEDNKFDAVISECTLCLLNKEKVIGEMVRVTRPGGIMGFHDLFWKDDAPDALKKSLEETEDERPETLEYWRTLLEKAGLQEIKTLDKSELIPQWMKESRRQLGVKGYIKVVLKVLRKWGPRGLRSVLRTEKVFSSPYMGYCILVGRKGEGSNKKISSYLE